MQQIVKLPSKSQVVGLVLMALMVSPASFALESNMDLTLDDNDGGSPKVILVDQDNKQLTMQKLTTGEGVLSNNEGSICFTPNNQSESICLNNDGTNMSLQFSDRSGIRSTRDGELQYSDKDGNWSNLDSTAPNVMKHLPFGARIMVGDIGDCNSNSLNIDKKVETAWKIQSAECKDNDITIKIGNAENYAVLGDLTNYTVSLTYEAKNRNQAVIVNDLTIPVVHDKEENQFKIAIEENNYVKQETYLNVMIFPANDQT